MAKALSSLSILLVVLFHCITTSAQPAVAPAKPADSPAPPANAPAQPASPPAQPALPPVQPAAKAPAPAQRALVPVTKVLLPLDIFNPKPKKVAAGLAPVVAPTSSKPKPTKEDAPLTPSAAAKVDEAAAVSLTRHGMLESIGVAVVAFFVIKRT
ncbi:predicted GPI-anchored protein 58 [Corylus avellana]|uniref:predicted GPI-anchored protein 58 n=1 Tax=Corylus avellana TaxID=13451 RepID=UPI00286B50DF|nr:predicted GPI-anchored protein 58 [Corylus avellana]